MSARITTLAVGLVMTAVLAFGVKVYAEGPYWCYMECEGCTFEADDCEYCYFDSQECTTTRLNCESFEINCIE